MQNTTEKTKKVSIYFAVINWHKEEQLNQIKQTACSIFGGYTLSENFGGWTSDNNELMQETSYKLEIFTNKEDIYTENLVQHICKIAKQIEVYYTSESITLNKTINN